MPEAEGRGCLKKETVEAERRESEFFEGLAVGPARQGQKDRY